MATMLSSSTLRAYGVAFGALSGILEKGEAFAAAKKIDASILLQTRLAPDMFPLSRQVQIATDLAKNGVARLAAFEPPRFEDTETTFSELKARIARTVAILETIDASNVEASFDRTIVFPMGATKKGEMRGADYLALFVTPNVYFHISAAYAILRHCGVDVGKSDFLGAIPISIS